MCEGGGTAAENPESTNHALHRHPSDSPTLSLADSLICLAAASTAAASAALPGSGRRPCSAWNASSAWKPRCSSGERSSCGTWAGGQRVSEAGGSPDDVIHCCTHPATTPYNDRAPPSQALTAHAQTHTLEKSESRNSPGSCSARASGLKASVLELLCCVTMPPRW